MVVIVNFSGSTSYDVETSRKCNGSVGQLDLAEAKNFVEQ
jgi:hypothetical protein